ncbi:hypothetical protein LTR05_001615 [Lithohypha guttulata]|uniref:Uncharacterized protein n=1 Tax=Lithohypha guttulata TaxID=1690604 RepID=A0AAN7T7S3_9EURO|nr:hypothetical protein LTR05_001615 [Lithohypha guttulata]
MASPKPTPFLRTANTSITGSANARGGNASTLSDNVLSNIIQQYLLDSDLHACLQLRQVNRWFNDEVLCSLFILQIKDLEDSVAYKRIPRHIGYLQLQGFLNKRSQPRKKGHRAIRKAILRTLGYDPHDANTILNTCLCYRPQQVCFGQVVGSSSTSSCNDHDMMNAVFSVFGSLVFSLGGSSDHFNQLWYRDERYWRLLVACHRGDVPALQDLLEEYTADDSVSQDMVASILCDCSVVAARQDRPSIIDELYIEAREHEEVLSKLTHMPAVSNPLLEAIRLGYREVLKRLLKWQWKFNSGNCSYVDAMQLIMNTKTYQNNDEAMCGGMLRVLFDWTDTWRNIAEMKGFLIQVGQNNQQSFLEIAISALRSQHYFRHERGTEGSFSASQPLLALTEHGKLEMLKLFLDNRKLLLPHTDTAQDMRMRGLVICDELDRRSEARVPILKLIMHYSQDLVDSKRELQQMLMPHYGTRLDKWAWLAMTVGLDSVCEDYENQTLGSLLLGKAVEGLKVETVRFLVNNNVQLESEARTFQVYEDDVWEMARLKKVKELLQRGGQGDYTRRRVLETTFTLTKAGPKRKRDDTSLKNNGSVRIRTTGISGKAVTSPLSSRFPRRNSVVSRKSNGRKSRQIVSIASVSASTSDVGE